MARARRSPLAIHLAETTAELELLAAGRGELAEMLQAFDVWRPELFAEPRRPLDFLKAMSELESGLVIHGNYLDEEEARLLAECGGLTLVVCPRTHRYFGHRPHPWPRVLHLGGRVALGTDSRASNPDLNLWREAVALVRSEPSVHPADVLRMATTAGETALFGADASRQTLIGRTLTELTVIALQDRPSSDAYDLLFDPSSGGMPSPSAASA
jgi:cytosine/adenosine deaminase-related metal-dependent hydrolase